MFDIDYIIIRYVASIVVVLAWLVVILVCVSVYNRNWDR